MRVVLGFGRQKDESAFKAVKNSYYIFMFFKLLLMLTLIPIAELALLIEIGRHIGLWPTIGIVLSTGIAGGIMLHSQGAGTLARFKRELAEGRFPGNTIIEGIAILLGGAFLLTPGVITDLCGLFLLIPPTRAIFIAILKRYLKVRFGLEEIIRISRDDTPLDPNMRV